MAYPDDLLVDGEQVVLQRHPHAGMLVVPVLVLLLVVGVCVFLAALVREQAWAPWAWLGLGAVGAGLVARLTVLPVIRWRTTHFVVTTRRVLAREGVLSRTGIDIPMSRIDSESASDEPLEFTDVPRVERVHALLYQEVAGDES